ncbi:hypothetical protein Zmor_018550 [Zophobas morio]|uniref:DUF4817 domain-containing protein n=1 Tax=Zophobas morio TaxID=2755281 RepID=A0AA38ME26_9CUCU|nr:hypothetical protein Zmor_018550 [Zophobas morio]
MIESYFRNRGTIEGEWSYNSVAVLQEFQQKCGVHHKKGAGRPTLCTSEVIDDVEEFMENNPSTSSRHLSQEVGLSVGTSHRIVKKSSIFFGTHFMPIELLPADINRRIPYW